MPHTTRDVPPPDLELADGATVEDVVRLTASGPSVSVRRSAIQNAGLGVFTLREIKKDEVIPQCTYGGHLKTLMQARSTKNKHYLMALHFNVHVDALDDVYLGYLGRYVNDLEGCAGDDGDEKINDEKEIVENNVCFVKDPETRSARLRALRDIEPGEELTAAYGRQYWEHVRAMEGKDRG